MTDNLISELPGLQPQFRHGSGELPSAELLLAFAD
jgi:hypothetical protein